MPAANRIKIANDGLIFREDFLNPQTAAANGLTWTGNPWQSRGFIITNQTVTLNKIATSIQKPPITIIAQLNLSAFTADYRTILRLEMGGSPVFSCGLMFGVNKLFWYNGAAVYQSNNYTVKNGSIVAFSYDGSNAYYYQDGSSLGGSANTWTYRTGAYNLIIGYNGTTYLNTTLYNLQIYNRALSAEEIRTHYKTTRGLLT